MVWFLFLHILEVFLLVYFGVCVQVEITKLIPWSIDETTPMEPENSHGDDQPLLGGEGDVSGGERPYGEDANSDGDCEDNVDFLGATEHVIRSRQKLNCVASVSSLRIKPVQISQHHIPLCRMVAMRMVRPCLPSDLTKLE